MKHFNLVKSLTRVNNIITLPFREGHGVGLKSIKMGLLCLSLTIFGVNEVWGESTKYSKASAITSPTGTGMGSVYVSNSSSGPWNSQTAENSTTNTSSEVTHKYYFYAPDNSSNGYTFKGWANSETFNSGSGFVKTAYEQSKETSTTDKNSAPTLTRYAIYARLIADSQESGSTINFGDVSVGKSASKEITVKHTHVSDVTATCDDKQFTASVTTNTTSYQTEMTSEVSIEFKPSIDSKGPQNSTLTIKGTNLETILTYTLEGTVYVAPIITWKDVDGKELVDGTPLNVGDLIQASSPSGQVVYADYASNFDLVDEGEGNVYLQVKETATVGECTIKATIEKKGDPSWTYAGEQSLRVNITNKQKVQIIWNDDISDLDNSQQDFGYTIPLTAKVYKMDGTYIKAASYRTDPASSSVVEIVNGNELKVIAQGGPVKVIAYVNEDDTYSAAEMTKNVTVYDMGDACATTDGPISISLTSSKNSVENSEFSTPGTITVTHGGRATSDITYYEYGKNGQELFKDTYDPDEIASKLNGKKMNPATTKIKFSASVTNPLRQHDITVTITRNTYSYVYNEDGSAISTDWDITDIKPGDIVPKKYKVDYSNVPVVISLAKNDGLWTIDTKRIGKCGDSNTGYVTVKFQSSKAGDFSNTLYFKTNTNDPIATINLTASVDKSDQVVESCNIADSYLTTDASEALAAKTVLGKTDFTFFVKNGTDPNGIVHIDANNVLTFTGSGTATIIAHRDGDDTYNELNAGYPITISKVTPTISIKPTATAMTYGKALSTSILSGGKATVTLRGIADTEVEGTWAWKNPSQVITDVAGTHEYAIVFTPTDGGMYNSVEGTATVTVKYIPTITWKSFEHIYAGQILEDVASTFYNGNPVDLQLTYTNVSGSFAVDGNKLHIDKQFTEAHNATVRVTTTETDYYAQTSAEHTYYLESKALPKFYLNGVEMSTETENHLTLKVGETANVSFDPIEESAFTYTTNAQFVTYVHDATQHAGVFTATASGDEGFQFHQAGTTTVFDRICQMHIWVQKHTNTLSSPIHDNDVWMVDSIYAGDMYSIVDDGYTGQAQEDVVVESSDEAVIRHMQDGSWKAVGEGTATITMRQFNNAYWTGDTITRVIKVQKHTPIITWNIENAQYPWSSVISTPVTSSNTDIPFTITSNNKSVADYVDGRIVVYNTTGTVTFTLAQEGNYKWNAATTNLTKSFSTFQPANHVPFTLNNNNNTNFYSTHSGTYTWSNGYKIGNGGINTFNKNTSSVTIRFTGVPDKLSFTKTLSKFGLSLPGDGDCNCYVYESADGSSWSQCWKDVERIETKNVSNIQLQPTTRYLKFEYKESCVYCTYSNITVTERSSIEPQASSLDFGTGYNGNTAAKRSVDVNWYSVMPCTVAISGADASQFYVGDDSKTIASSLDNSGIVTLNVFYTHEENKSHTATLTITSADTPAKMATIQLAGTTERAPQEIIWREDITPLPHNGGLYEGAALASSGGEVVLTSDDESIVKVVGNGLQPVGVGKTMVHAYQAGDDIKWQPVNATKEIEVTSLSVQHLIWNDQLNNIKRTDGQTVNITLTAQSDAIALDPSLVVTYELDDDAKAFASVTDNQLTITGWGSGYITAKQVGNANYVPAQQTKRLVSRNPDVDCRALAAEDANEYTLHTIASQEINITNGEPATIEFDAKMDLTAIGEGLHLDEWYNDSWHEATYIDWDVMAKNLGNYAHYGPYNLNRKTTKVRFYTNTGATMRRYFKNVEVTLARYLEVAQNDMSFAGVDKGAFLDQTFYINYSNLRGTLDVELQNTSSNLQVITTTVGNDCGEIGQMVPVKIRCTGNVCGTENNVIVLSNKGQKLEVPVSATVVPPSQNITWNPQTTILTTDVVALNATCTSNLPISYSSNNTDVATVQQDGSGVWSMTIIKDGTVTITASQAGSADWSPAPDKNVVFNISKATPVVTTWATPSEVTKWSALSTSTLTGGEASVAGSFSWQDGTIQVERGNSGYTMVFTPTNTNWYNTVTNTIVVPVAKDPQTITWNYTPQPMYCNAELYFDAVASSGLKVRYESSDPTVAYVNDNRLVIIKGGNVTITAVQDGDDTWAYTSLSKNLEILRWTPNIVIKPVANSMLIGQHLDNATLNGGRAELGDKQVDGSFSWQNGSVETIDVAGKATRVVVFTPSNPNHYNSATCEVEVDVKKYAPTVTHTLSATDITYGQALNASSLNGTLTAMDEVKYPHEEVAGTYNWKETTKQLSAGKHTEIVRFTPFNLDWYDVVDIEISVVVNKAHATTATAVVNMLYGQTLEEVLPINTTADVVSGVVEGIITWDASVDVEAIPAQGEYDYPIHLAITDPNYVAETIDGTCHVVVEKGFVFDGHGGSSDWNTEGNWVDGSQPTGMEDKVIVIADATIINSEINVGAITIKQGVDVIIEEDGVLNVGDYDCVSRKQYGNMVVKNGGQLNLNTGEVQVNDFTLEASLGGQKDAERVSARSGSITNAEQLKVNGNAYFDIALDANGECTQGWYDLTVPFPVNALTGVQRFENGVLRTNLKNEVNYAIMSYHEDVRAQGKYGWSKFRGIMQPGQCYTITIDDYHNVYRFVKTSTGSLNASNTLQVTATVGEGGDENKGWNCVGNGTCHHANIAIEGVDKVQIYDHATNSYSPINFADKTFAVGSAFFVQTPQSESILYSQHVSDGVLYAPRRAPHATQEFLVTLSSIKDQSVADKLYLSASDDATNTYEIGHDLSKFGVSSTIAQMWCTAYNMQLCDVELPWVGETAIFPIEIFAPKTGEYILSVPQTHKDEQLFLLYDGIVMTELTASEFILPLNKGVNKNYALQIVTNRSIATTNEDNEMLQNASTRKAIVNDKLYIFYGDKIFDANGKRIK